jgi:hypothetical protein
VYERELAVVFLWEVVGGAAFGLGSGLLADVLLRSVDNYQVEMLPSPALVAGFRSLSTSTRSVEHCETICARTPSSRMDCLGTWLEGAATLALPCPPTVVRARPGVSEMPRHDPTTTGRLSLCRWPSRLP